MSSHLLLINFKAAREVWSRLKLSDIRADLSICTQPEVLSNTVLRNEPAAMNCVHVVLVVEQHE